MDFWNSYYLSIERMMVLKSYNPDNFFSILSKLFAHRHLMTTEFTTSFDCIKNLFYDTNLKREFRNGFTVHHNLK